MCFIPILPWLWKLYMGAATSSNGKWRLPMNWWGRTQWQKKRAVHATSVRVILISAVVRTWIGDCLNTHKISFVFCTQRSQIMWFWVLCISILRDGLCVHFYKILKGACCYFQLSICSLSFAISVLSRRSNGTEIITLLEDSDGFISHNQNHGRHWLMCHQAISGNATDLVLREHFCFNMFKLCHNTGSNVYGIANPWFFADIYSTKPNIFVLFLSCLLSPHELCALQLW